MVIAAIFLGCAYFVALRELPPRATPFARSQSSPVGARWHDGSWYWMENKDGGRLVKGAAPSPVILDSAEGIGDFSVSGAKIAWSARGHGRWTINVGSTDGKSKREIWSGDAKPAGPLLADDKVFWVQQNRPKVEGAEILPPLGASCTILTASATEGPTTAIREMPEPQGQQVIGIRGNDLYLSVFRPGYLGATAIFLVPLDGSTPRRLATTAARQNAALTKDGKLYWMSASREAGFYSLTVAARRLARDGKSEAGTDWLPYGGRFAEEDGRLYYVDDTIASNAWFIHDRREMPRPIRIPDGHLVLGVGGGKMLTRRITEVNPSNVSLFEVPLP